MPQEIVETRRYLKSPFGFIVLLPLLSIIFPVLYFSQVLLGVSATTSNLFFFSLLLASLGSLVLLGSSCGSYFQLGPEERRQNMLLFRAVVYTILIAFILIVPVAIVHRVAVAAIKFLHLDT